MGREVRRVPANWEHPKSDRGGDYYKPLFDRYESDRRIWECYEEDLEPQPDDYMLVGVPDEERTHYQMYETTSEGTPISPVFETPEELARWLADNGASSFANFTATYEEWLKVCQERGDFYLMAEKI